ncbi:exosortase F system-associated protein [Tamlana sp. 2201CG12-4]|uniref:exosortase F system-associated membrane protein n=1 Tax=Tamlana sp. 2201CG12-4 TaxID=3112582 RepID=UPI002DBD40D2|nr:exosortase F system-associated protein [Tamlana sp. 2201CG12-4]MEC3905576.1 exosortase F system-associated protein [Tamlana sp. 2201CG12-4]
MHKVFRYILLFILFLMLILIRFFENDLFYDPYLTFFQGDYLYIDSPRREVAKLVAYTTLRYLLNSMVSLAILFLVFKNLNMVKFSGLIYVIAFVMLILIYLYFVINPRQEDYYLFFNIRRFLIQPILLILLLPAFYYHKLKA